MSAIPPPSTFSAFLFDPGDDERAPACELRGRKLSRKTGIGAHQQYQGRTDTYLTPPPLIRALGEFDLDPCCPHTMPWATADVMMHEPTDGLRERWYRRVWLNPPYGPRLGKWMHKMATHNHGTALIFARTDTEVFHRDVFPVAHAMLFLQGRITFHDAAGTPCIYNAGGPSVLIAYGLADALKLADSLIPGHFIALKPLH